METATTRNLTQCTLSLYSTGVLTFIGPATLPLSHTHQGLRYSDKNRTYRAEKRKEAATAKLSTSTQGAIIITFLDAENALQEPTSLPQSKNTMIKKGFLYTYLCYFS